ncbi:MAG: hypothetical protein ACRCX2_16295 [Paraclostridium sp.]
MKKVLCSVLTIIFLTSSISFAQPSQGTTASIKSLEMVNNNLGIIVKNIISRTYEDESIKKDLKYNSSLLETIYNDTLFEYKEDLKNKDKTTLQKRVEGTVFYIASLYSLSINGIALYLEDKSANESFLLDAISEYREGGIALSVLKNFLK